MARSEQILSVFVASPSDVSDERNALEEIIRELNITWSREIGLRLELVRWETHAFPGSGQDAQDVINSKIPDDYDIFIGIMWHRFGTPTGRYGSGTIEEFQRAKKRAVEKPGSVKIMFYFRGSLPNSISEIDGGELLKVQNFRQELGDEGNLYWQYRDVAEFEKLARMHLSRQVQEWRSEENKGDHYSNKKETMHDYNIKDDDDFGFIDLVDIFEQQIGVNSEIIGRISSSISDLGEKLNDHALALNAISQTSEANKSVDRQEIKKRISRAALDMTQFSERVSVEIPLFRDSLNTGINAFIKSIELSVDFEEDDSSRDQMQDSLYAIEYMIEASNNTLDSTESFRKSVYALPRMTSDINKAKKRVVLVLEQLINELKSGRNLALEAANVVKDRISDKDN